MGEITSNRQQPGSVNTYVLRSASLAMMEDLEAYNHSDIYLKWAQNSGISPKEVGI